MRPWKVIIPVRNGSEKNKIYIFSASNIAREHYNNSLDLQLNHQPKFKFLVKDMFV